MIILHENVLIEQLDAQVETTTASGLILTGTSEDTAYQKARVKAVGRSITDSNIQPTNTVLVTKGTGTPIKGDNGVNYLLIPYTAIVAVL